MVVDLPQEMREIALPTFFLALFSFAGGMVVPVLSPYIKAAGFSDIGVSLLFAIFPLTVIVLSPMVGHASDYVGRYRIIFLGIIFYITSLILFLINQSVLVFILAQISAALGVTSIGLISLAKIEDLVPEEERGAYSGIALSIQSAALMTGTLAGGFAADILGIRSPFILALGVMGILFIISLLRRGSLPADFKKRDLNVIADLKNFLEIERLRGMAVLGFFMHGKGEAIKVFFPLFVLDELGLTYSEIGTAMFLLGGFHVFQFIMGRYVDVHGSERSVLAGVVVTGLGAIVLSTLSDILLIYLLFAAYSIGGSLWNVSAWTLMSEEGVSRGMEGEVVGSYQSLAKMGSFASLLVNGLIVTVWGTRFLFALHGTLTLAAAATAYILFRKG